MRTIPWYQSESMWGGITAVLAPALFALLIHYGVLDAEGAALWGGLLTAVAGLVVLYGRYNGGQPASAIRLRKQ